MTIFRRTAAVLAGALLLATLTPAPAAWADPCPANALCLFPGTGYTGRVAAFYPSQDGLGNGSELWDHRHSWINQQASSVRNNTREHWDLVDWGWRSCHYGGGWLSVRPGEVLPNLGNFPGANNTTSCVNLLHR